MSVAPAYNYDDARQPAPELNKGLTDLTIIGVPGAYHNRKPAPGGYPSKFNKDALKLWIKMLDTPAFKEKTKGVSIDLAWHLAIQAFLGVCEDEGIFPFENATDSTKNDFIIDFVRRGRILVVQFMNECKMFEHVKVRKAFREYVRKDNGLVINTWAELFEVKDPNFEKWIQTSPMPRYLKYVDNRYIKVIQPHVQSWIRYINPNRVTLGFTIEVAGTVNVPGKAIPKRKEVDAYIDRAIWLPILRAHRFDNVINRLF